MLAARFAREIGTSIGTFRPLESTNAMSGRLRSNSVFAARAIGTGLSVSAALHAGRETERWLQAVAMRLSDHLGVRTVCAAAAYGEWEEARKGTLRPGMLADFVVWDRDLLTVSISVAKAVQG